MEHRMKCPAGRYCRLTFALSASSIPGVTVPGTQRPPIILSRSSGCTWGQTGAAFKLISLFAIPLKTRTRVHWHPNVYNVLCPHTNLLSVSGVSWGKLQCILRFLSSLTYFLGFEQWYLWRKIPQIHFFLTLPLAAVLTTGPSIHQLTSNLDQFSVIPHSWIASVHRVPEPDNGSTMARWQMEWIRFDQQLANGYHSFRQHFEIPTLSTHGLMPAPSTPLRNKTQNSKAAAMSGFSWNQQLPRTNLLLWSTYLMICCSMSGRRNLNFWHADFACVSILVSFFLPTCWHNSGSSRIAMDRPTTFVITYFRNTVTCTESLCFSKNWRVGRSLRQINVVNPRVPNVKLSQWKGSIFDFWWPGRPIIHCHSAWLTYSKSMNIVDSPELRELRLYLNYNLGDNDISYHSKRLSLGISSTVWEDATRNQGQTKWCRLMPITAKL